VLRWSVASVCLLLAPSIAPALQMTAPTGPPTAVRLCGTTTTALQVRGEQKQGPAVDAELANRGIGGGPQVLGHSFEGG